MTAADLSSLLPGFLWTTHGAEIRGASSALAVSVIGGDVALTMPTGAVRYDRAETPEEVDSVVRGWLGYRRKLLLRQVEGIDEAMAPGVAPGQGRLFGGAS